MATLCCAALSTGFGCSLRLEDFLNAFDDGETAAQSATPLEVAELGPGDRLFVVTCSYKLADKTQYMADPDDRFVLAANSMGFHLISALSTHEKATT
jgi:hypothetical protein